MNARMRKIGLGMAVATLGVGGIQVVTSAPAAAVAGLVRVVSQPEPNNNLPDTSTSVQCPTSSPRIVGGGIVINDPQRRAFARFMQPTKNQNGGPDFYSVAATVPPGFVGTYSLEAIAVCASDAAVPGHEVLAGTPTTPSSSPRQETLRGCSSSTKRVIGFGGGVLDGGQEVGLQIIRADGLRGITRVYAHEDASGYDRQWKLQAFVICMTSNDNTRPAGSAVSGDTASTLCSDSPNRFVHGLGGGAWDGIGLIHQILPSRNLKQGTVIITSGSTAAFTSKICIP